MEARYRIASRRIASRGNRERFHVCVLAGIHPVKRTRAYVQITAWSREGVIAKLERLELMRETPLVHSTMTYSQYATRVAGILSRGMEKGMELMERVTGELQVAKTTIRDVRQIVQRIEGDDASYQEKQAAMRILRRISEDAAECNVVRGALFRKARIKKPERKAQKVLEGDALDHFLSLDPADPVNACLLGNFYGGCRPGEAIAIQTNDIEPSTGAVWIIKQIIENGERAEKSPELTVTKTGRGRVIYPGKEFFDMLRAGGILKAEDHDRENQFCFTGQDGKPVHLADMRRRYREWMAGTGFEDESLRILRRSRITQLYFSGLAGALQRCAAMAGHTSERTTMQYYVVVTEARRRALQKADDAYYRGMMRMSTGDG